MESNFIISKLKTKQNNKKTQKMSIKRVFKWERNYAKSKGLD